jgi:Tfp pilus assembly protein PilX
MLKRSGIFLKDQRGVALVIALFMIIVLSLIGLASVSGSVFEIKLSGNKRGVTNAFYAADSGTQVAASNLASFDLSKYDAANQYKYSQDASNINPTKADIVITHDTMRSGAPRGSGMGATGSIGFMYFLVESTGQDQVESNFLKSNCTVEQEVMRIIPTMQGGN